MLERRYFLKRYSTILKSHLIRLTQDRKRHEVLFKILTCKEEQ